MDVQLFLKATGGHKEVLDEWVSGTSLRALIQEDPALLWLKYHGAFYGLEEDTKEYSFLEWIGDKGRAFEAACIRNVAPEAVQAMDDDKDVRKVQGLTRTLALMARKVPVITKAALWWAPEKIYGSADLIVLTSWLYAKFPHLKPAHADGEPDHYVVLDCKFTTGLDKSDKATDLACNTAQVRMYSYMLGQLQGHHMPKAAYLVTRDRPFDPLPVPVDHFLDAPLDPFLAQQRDLHTHIKLHGHQYTPWTHDMVRCNFSNSHDEPWSGAKKKIMRELTPGGALEMLPHVGRVQAEALREQDYPSVGEMLRYMPEQLPLEKLHGIGDKTAARIRAVLRANLMNAASPVSAAHLPPRCDVELFVDYEYFTNINVDFETQWPSLEGREMIFMVGVGWEDRGRWQYRQFVAEAETREAERAMFEKFLLFLEACGVFVSAGNAVLYHWSNAEVWQSRAAAERLGLPQLATLPWFDLQKPAHAVPLGLPGCWDYGLKSVAKALGNVSVEHQVEWPSGLADGLSASVMGWRMYEQAEPLQSPELGMLSQYLEIDCKAMWAVLSWMRAVAVEGHHWYEPVKQKRETSKPKPSKTRRGPKGKRSRRRASGVGWYRSLFGELEHDLVDGEALRAPLGQYKMQWCKAHGSRRDGARRTLWRGDTQRK